MRKQLLALTFFAALITFSASAQQDPLYSLYLNNPIAINPAYTGLNDNLNLNIGYRDQWAGIPGGPTTATFTAHMSINQNKMGVGLMAVRDNLGSLTNTQFTPTVSYKLKLSDDRILSFGMLGGIVSYQGDASKVNVKDKQDPQFMNNFSSTKPMIGAGVMLKTESYLLGLSVPRLLNSTVNTGNGTYSAYQQHFYLFGSYIFPLSERIQFKPSTLIKYVKGAPISADLNLNLNIDRNYTVGVYTRNLNAYGILAQINFAQYFRLSYAFELPTNKSVGAKYNSNEINLGFRFAALSYHNRSISNW